MFIFMIIIYVFTGASFILLLLTGLQGYLGFTLLGVNHPTIGFLTAIIYLFTEVMVMFFFVGTGISIKEYVHDQNGDPQLHARSVAIKRKLYPPTLLNVLLVMAVFIVGGGVDTNVIPAWIHNILFLTAIGHFAITIRKQHICFKENTILVLKMVNISPNSDKAEIKKAES